MKKWLTAVTLLIFYTFSFAAKDKTIPLLEIKGAKWTNEEKAFIKELNKKGSIKIATKLSSAVYLPQKDGTISGFHYNVLNEFAKLAEVKIDVNLVSWNDYFYKDGADIERIKTDSNYFYVPTLIENVDLYIDGITVLPWREKMFDIIKFVPSRQMLITRKENKPLRIEELNNKNCAMVEDTSMEINLEKIKKDKSIDFNYMYIEDFDSMDKMVSEGKADFTVYDSDRAFAACRNYKNLTIVMPISEPEIMGWAINKKNRLLKSILEKYLKYAQETAILDKYWQEEYGVTFVEYLKILKLR